MTSGMTARSARRRYALVSFLSWLPSGLMMAPMVLLMTDRGLSLGEVGLVMSVHSAVVVALELPTGGLADVIGRRGVLAASAVVSAVALTVMAFSDSVALFALAALLKGVARALSSGPAQAWYVDTVHALEGADADLKPGLAAGEAMGSVALCAGVLTGGFVPLLLAGRLAGPVVPLAVPCLLAAAAAVALFAVVFVALPEPPHARSSAAAVLRGVPATIGAGVRLATRDGVVARLLAVSMAGGVTLAAIELLTPGRLAELTGSADTGSTAYGVVTAVGFAGSAAGSGLAPWLARIAGASNRGAVAGAVVLALALGVLAASAGLPGAAGLAVAAGAYAVMFVGMSASGLLHAEILHGRVDAGRRATLLSVDSLALQAGAFAGNLGMGVLAGQAGRSAAWSTPPAVTLPGASLYLGVSRGRAGRPSRAGAAAAPPDSGSRSTA